VQSVITSPLARAMATGTGGKTSPFRPGFSGKGTNGMDSVVRAPVAVSVVVSVGPEPPSTSGSAKPAFFSASWAMPVRCTSKPLGSTVSPLPCSRVTSSWMA
jgi:hypothetical protein